MSAEIIAISLGVVQSSTFTTQLAVLTGVAVLMTAGVYGLVGGIVKLDDAGLYLGRRQGSTVVRAMQRGLGNGLLTVAPWLMKALSCVGTAAMFMVGGGLLLHGVPPLQHAIEVVVGWLTGVAWAGQPGAICDRCLRRTTFGVAGAAGGYPGKASAQSPCGSQLVGATSLLKGAVEGVGQSRCLQASLQA